MASTSTPKILFKHLANPRTLQTGVYTPELEQALSKYFDCPTFPVNSGRSAIFLALKALGINQNDEVLIQAYTCNAVPNPVLWTGAVPVYVDIEEDTLNMSIEDLKKKITPKTKAIIVQHTFGNPARIREILKIADTDKLKVIEDCAHSLGAKVENKLLGTFGDLAIISFGREKVISSLTGGALIVNDKSLLDQVEREIKNLRALPLSKIIQEVVNYVSWRTVFRKIYSKEWGNNFVKHLYQYDFINVITSKKELDGLQPDWYPSAMANVFAHIALNELENIQNYYQKRKLIAEKYFEKINPDKLKLLPAHDGIYLRVVAFHPKAYLFLERAAKEKLNFGNWYNSVIYPDSVHLAKLGYISGSCPVAENLAHQTVNLPNYIGMGETEVNRVIDFVNNFN